MSSDGRGYRARFRRWCFTVHAANGAADWTHEGKAQVDRIRYIVYQRERCPTTGALHVQGYVEVKGSVERAPLQALLGIGDSHCERARGTADQNRTYCTKEFNDDGSRKRADGEGMGPFEYGIPASTGQGRRKDLDEVKEILDEREDLLDAFESEHFGTVVRCHRGLSLYLQLRRERRAVQNPREKVAVRWMSGPTGCGKTYWIRKTVPVEDIYYWDMRAPQKWFDGYQNQSTLVIEEFRREQVPDIEYMLRLLEPTPLRLQVKGGSAQAAWKNVIVTSNIPFEEMYSEINTDHRQLAALKNRIAWFGVKSYPVESEPVWTENSDCRFFR